jgi:hypothetical protein
MPLQTQTQAVGNDTYQAHVETAVSKFDTDDNYSLAFEILV